MSNSPLLQCRDLCKRYQEGSVQTDVLRNVTFDVQPGELMAIVGSSGSGKSTLLHLLGGLDAPTSGEVVFDGRSLNGMSSSAKAELRNRELGFIYQFHHLLPDFTALENVAMPLLIGKVNKGEAQTRAREMLAAVGLEHRAAHRPSELSGENASAWLSPVHWLTARAWSWPMSRPVTWMPATPMLFSNS